MLPISPSRQHSRSSSPWAPSPSAERGPTRSWRPSALASASASRSSGRYVGGVIRAERDAHALLEQRLAIARELHDVVAHHVSVIGIQAAAARRTIGRSPDETVAALSAIEASSRAAVLEMQRLVTTLREPDVAGSSDGPRGGGVPFRHRPRPLPTCPGCASGWKWRACGSNGRASTILGSWPSGLDPGRPLPGRPGSPDQCPQTWAGGKVTVSVHHDGDWLVLSIVQRPGRPQAPPDPWWWARDPRDARADGAVGGSLVAGPDRRWRFHVTARIAVRTDRSHA